MYRIIELDWTSAKKMECLATIQYVELLPIYTYGASYTCGYFQMLIFKIRLCVNVTIE